MKIVFRTAKRMRDRLPLVAAVSKLERSYAKADR